ncbi:Aurofusarin cluster transcription factor aurR2 [Colletotrichum orbiculare MAFF 240422]|uniref:Aurofusarin cluster transcription factor aurR2 n=1 Tax=Colletotrichum orbiculare (strain 104-T / ATCC 96160 / CBS 514.97 / LARS 414 / MAFF 240422) TaxID=1213857 RepID=N4VLT5_COLOR|nr:Aurofusarin cluster transcription factor aurR2 [Colletotrichum orbiculare MAFF 240422]
MTNKRECREPSPAPPRKPRRRNNHALHEKIAEIESLLQRYVADPRAGEGQGSTLSAELEGIPSDEPAPGSLDKRRSCPDQGKLVNNWDGNVEFRDSKTMAAVFEDLQTIGALIDVEFEQSGWLPAIIPPDSNRPSYFPGVPLPVQISACLPSPDGMSVLWDAFLERVDPVTKIIHVPTVRRRMAEAMSSFSCLSSSTQALLFAIFLVASGSLSRREHWAKLGRLKVDAIGDFERGLRLVLIGMNYLKNLNLEVLRSLTLYSLFQQTPFGSQDPWILNGVVVNIAYRLGLHVDPSHAKLSPFDCEMRRRLWWQIACLETKASGEVGSGAHLLPKRGDTRIPANVNDEDLDPALTAEPQEHDGPTEMGFCIMRYEATSITLAQPPGLSIDDILWKQDLSSTSKASRQREEASAKIQSLLDVERKRLDPLERRLCPHPDTDSLHFMVRQGRQVLSRIVDLLTIPMEEAPEWGNEVHSPDDNYFRITLAVNEEMLVVKEAAGQRFAWLAGIEFKMPVFYYLAAQMQSRVSGSMADRAWHVVEKTYEFHEELWDLRQKEKMTLANLLLVAWEKRAAYFAVKRMGLPQPLFLNRLQDEVLTIKAEALGIL